MHRPQDSILWVHIILMTVAFGLIFPAGMVLGVSSPIFSAIRRSGI